MRTQPTDDAKTARVVGLVRFPVKSAGGEALERVHVDEYGVQGDRVWACVDDELMIGSAKLPRRWEGLLRTQATVRSSGAVDIAIRGEVFSVSSPAADEALSRLLGFTARLVDQAPHDPRVRRQVPKEPGLIPEWMPEARPGSEVTLSVAGTARIGSFVDFGPVHIVTTGELARLGRRLGSGPVAALRFRPNVVIDLPADPPVGTELRLGDAVLRIVLPTPRCVVPGLSHDQCGRDRSISTALASNYRRAVPGFGRAACFGTYAEIVHPGELKVGERLDIMSGHVESP